MAKVYSGDTSFYEKKLERVMNRLGVQSYQCDWTKKRSGGSCFVEMVYHGAAYRFENSTEKSEQQGKGLVFVSDLLAQVVLALEGMARAVENGIFTLDMLMEGVPALPAAEALPPCVLALGLDRMPQDATEVREQYHRMAKGMHPDLGGTDEAFQALRRNLAACLELVEAGTTGGTQRSGSDGVRTSDGV